MKLSRLKKLLFLHLAHLPMPSAHWRPVFYKISGVNVKFPKKTFIGEDVVIDTNFPEDVTLEERVRLTHGVKIVTHYLNSQTGKYERGKVHIKKNAYLGMNVLVVKPVVIGENSIVGAGSVVTKSIPDNEIWAGNPAHFVKKRI